MISKLKFSAPVILKPFIFNFITLNHYSTLYKRSDEKLEKMRIDSSMKGSKKCTLLRHVSEEIFKCYGFVDCYELTLRNTLASLI